MWWSKKSLVSKKLESVNRDPYSLAELKEKNIVLIIDDKEFDIVGTLQKNGFRVDHWRDIESISAVEKYPLIACDISGIGKNLRPGSSKGGIHVLNEIKKHYPDKFLIQYSTLGQDLDGALTQADIIYPKGTGIDVWQRDIENAFSELGNPKKRWVRMRRNISDRGIDAYDIFKIEQAYIAEILGEVPESNDDSLHNIGSKLLDPETGAIIRKFAVSTIAMGIKEAMST